MPQNRLGIIAGGGTLPLIVAQAAQKAGQPVHILGIEGEVDGEIRAHPHSFFRWGQIGRMFRILKQENCAEVVMIGGVSRPDLTTVRPDLGLLVHIPFILKLTLGGDDSLLSQIVGLFERKGFRVRGAHEIAPELLCQEGCLGRHKPQQKDDADIKKAVKAVQRMGELDIGQAAVVARLNVLAVEAAEGTNAMLARCRGVRQWGIPRRTGVLVKCPKPGQELRIDMPTIGPETVKRAAAAKLRGIALAASRVLIVDKQKVIDEADTLGLFVVGLQIDD